MPKGTVGHHLKVLEKAGLIRVVRTRQVRALTEKYYGRVARLFELKGVDSDAEDLRAGAHLGDDAAPGGGRGSCLGRPTRRAEPESAARA